MTEAVLAAVYVAGTIFLALRAKRIEETFRYHTCVALVCSAWPAMVVIVLWRSWR